MGGSFLRPGRDGVFPAGLQVFEIVEGLPLFIVYAILIGVAKGLHLDYIDRSEIQLEDRRGGLSRMLVGTGKVKRFILRHLAVKHPFIFFVFQLKLNLANEVGRVFWIWFMFATRVFAKLSDIDGVLDRDNNRPDITLLLDLRSRKAVGQLAVTLAFVGLFADAGDQIVWNCDARQILCQVKGRRLIRQCSCWEHPCNHDKA